jgi:hypothetical protein
MRGGFNLRSHHGHGQSFVSTKTARCSTLRRTRFAERSEMPNESGRATNPPSTCGDGNSGRWMSTTRMSASVEFVRSDSPHRLARWTGPPSLRGWSGRTLNCVLLRRFRLSIRRGCWRHHRYWSGRGRLDQGLKGLPLVGTSSGSGMQARPCPVRLTRHSDQADSPVALCASGCGCGPRRLMMKRVKIHTRTTG